MPNYLKAQQQLRRPIAEDFKQAFEACDAILGPTSPTTAFRPGEKSDDPVAMYMEVPAPRIDRLALCPDTLLTISTNRG